MQRFYVIHVFNANSYFSILGSGRTTRFSIDQSGVTSSRTPFESYSETNRQKKTCVHCSYLLRKTSMFIWLFLVC